MRGLYQVGSFPAYGRWAEWNGKYRDTIRKFLKGEPGQVGDMAQRIQGSPDLYAGRGPTASINFITTHDGFTLNHAHPVLRNRWHLRNQDRVGSGYADITWHGTQAWSTDWSADSRRLAFMLCGKHARGGTVPDNYVYVAMNMHWEGHWFELPRLPSDLRWHVFANTGATPPEDIWALGQEPLLADQGGMLLGDPSVVILVGK